MDVCSVKFRNLAEILPLPSQRTCMRNEVRILRIFYIRHKMVSRKNSISPQYLREVEISVKVAEVKSPGHFIVKETPGINSSSQANEFLDLEKSMQHFYSSLEPNFFQLPVKDSIIVVKHNNKYNRARVCSILSLAHGYMIKVYLLDYGKECNVPRIDVFEIQPDFLRLPVQAVDFKLSALEPMSYVLSNYDLACDLGQIPEWDSSAVTFVEDLLKGKIKVGIKVEGMNKECLFGTLHVTPYGGEAICLNDELVLKKYAAENPNCWNDIIKVNNTASRMDAYSDPCLQNKSSSPEPPKTSPASSTITSMSEKSTKMSSTQKLKALLKEKKAKMKPLEQNNEPLVLCPTSTKEILMHSESGKFLNVEERKNKIEASVSKLHEFQENIDFHLKETDNGTEINRHEEVKNIQISGREFHEKSNLIVSPMVVKDSSEILDSVSDNATIIKQENKCKESTFSPEKKTGSCYLNKLLKEHKKRKQRRESVETGYISSDVEHQISCDSSPTQTACKTENLPCVQTTEAKKSENFSSQVDEKTELPHDICNRSEVESEHSTGKPDNLTFEENITADVSSAASNVEQNKDSPKPLAENEQITEKKTAKSKVNPQKIKDFFHRHRKLALAKSKQTLVQSPPESDIDFENKKSCEILNANIDPKNSDLPVLDNTEETADALDTLIDNLSDSRKTSDSETDLPPHLLIHEEISKPIDFSNRSVWNKQVPALCFGVGVSKPMLSITEATFPSSVRKVLEKLNFEGPSSIQSVVWPTFLRNRSYAAIAPPHSGKTVAYLLPIVSNFLNQNVYPDSTKAAGPVAIIICSSWKKVQAVHDLLKLFLSGSRIKIVTYFADGRKKRSRVLAVMKGCDILISVPSFLLNFFKEDIICTKRCCHLIFDDGTNLLADYMKEVKEIMKIFGDAIQLREQINIPLQILFNGERWNGTVDSFVDKFMRKPLLLFTSFLEAAIYVKVPMFVHISEKADKENKLLELVKTNMKKIIVCTIDLNTALDVHSFLKSENVRSFLITEEMEHYISEGVIRDWECVNSTLPYCLVATDAALTGTNITDANFVIHYDVPEVSRLQFGYRFGCIIDHLKKLDKSNCGSHELIDFVNNQKKVDAFPNAPLCHYWKAFGKCKLPNCQNRHTITSILDTPNVVPNEGDIHAIVTHVFNASHFYVRILSYLLPDSEDVLSLSCEYANLGFKLKKFYSIESNRKIVERPVIGGNYIFQDEDKLVYRVKVMNIKEPSETECQKITLLYRDQGYIRSYSKCELYEEINFEKLPAPHAVEVYLCNIKTPDSCLDWNPFANDFIESLIMNKEVHGKIALCLGETLWLHPLVLREKLMLINDYLNLLTVEKALRKAEFAEENKEHLPILFKACANKITLPKKKEKAKPENQEIDLDLVDLKSQISYAFLELNVLEDIYVSSVISPDQIYVQRVKFLDCLDDLLEKINAAVEAKKLKKCSTLLNGMHCIAPFTDDRYYRAVVTNVLSESNEVQLFFVDFGDSCFSPKDSIYVLPPQFTLLPFQAIECELDGICAPHGGWSDKVTDFLEDLTREENNDMKMLELKAYTKLICYDAGNRYKVDIWNGDKTLSGQLLKEGLVDSAEKSVPVETPPVNSNNDDNEFFDDLPKGYSESSDEDIPLENKQHHSLFCVALAKMMMEGKSNSQAMEEAVKEMKENMNEKSSSDGVKNAEMTNKEMEEKTVKSPIFALQKLLSYRKKKEETKQIKPIIMWWDSPGKINMVIKLKDIEIYELDIQEDCFKFKTTLRGTDFYIKEQFYSVVCSQDYSVKNGPLGLSIAMSKKEEGKWPRLIKEVQKLPNIKYDLEHLDVSDPEDFPEGIPVDENSQNKGEVETECASDEDSASDDEKTVPTWKKMAEFRDPYNFVG
ncbi:hypothetical protein CDAR_605451 [Caerostris darwini]|uniref:Probable ATP-dependent RNA helicase spindle-E n=1 Tax=Caerostris darwini TaxID=1538125 RepID=A0AAV4RAL2_9ARAC|nr:hypothetical protein CDAR_605451 [Caerostris darwini]